MIDAAGERPGGNVWRHYVPGDAMRRHCASGAVQELRKGTVQTIEDVFQLGSGP